MAPAVIGAVLGVQSIVLVIVVLLLFVKNKATHSQSANKPPQPCDSSDIRMDRKIMIKPCDNDNTTSDAIVTKPNEVYGVRSLREKNLT